MGSTALSPLGPHAPPSWRSGPRQWWGQRRDGGYETEEGLLLRLRPVPPSGCANAAFAHTTWEWTQPSVVCLAHISCLTPVQALLRVFNLLSMTYFYSVWKRRSHRNTSTTPYFCSWKPKTEKGMQVAVSWASDRWQRRKSGCFVIRATPRHTPEAPLPHWHQPLDPRVEKCQDLGRRLRIVKVTFLLLNQQIITNGCLLINNLVAKVIRI